MLPTLTHTLQLATRMYGSADCLGTRRRGEAYAYMSYTDVEVSAHAIGSALVTLASTRQHSE